MEREVCVAILYFSKSGKYGAYALAAALESRLNNVFVELLDLDRCSTPIQRLIDLSKRCRKIVVGISFNSFKIDVVRSLVRLVKRYVSNCLVVGGGPHPSADPYGSLTKLGFDLVVVGEGEETFVDLVENFSEGGDGIVCGVAYRDGDKVVVRRRCRKVDLNSYPPTPTWRGIFAPIEIMRGCSSACRFCQVSFLFGPPRYRDVDVIVDYAREMWRRGLRDLRFVAPNSFGYGSPDGMKPAPDRLLELVHKLRMVADRYGGRIFLGTFPSEVRPDSVDKDLVKELRKLVDNRKVIVGAQSGSDRVLKLMHRNHTVQDVMNAVNALIEAGFEVDVDIIIGLPGEEEEDIEETLKLCDQLARAGAKLHLHTFIPLPGTPLDEAPPGRVPKRVKKTLLRYISDGRAYGYWLEQEALAQCIARYRANKLFYTLREQAKLVKTTIC